MTSQKGGRGRPRREYHIRVRAERRETPDYNKLARALLEHAAMEQARFEKKATDSPSSDRHQSGRPEADGGTGGGND